MAKLRRVVAIGGLALVPSAVACGSDEQRACSARVVQQTLADVGARSTGEAMVRHCGDVTGDGESDALFTVVSGGTAGDIAFGVLRGGPDGSSGGLVLYKSGYKLGVKRISDEAFDVAQPHFAAQDSNCCPSSFRLRRYTWAGDRFTPGRTRSMKELPRDSGA